MLGIGTHVSLLFSALGTDLIGSILGPVHDVYVSFMGVDMCVTPVVSGRYGFLDIVYSVSF